MYCILIWNMRNNRHMELRRPKLPGQQKRMTMTETQAPDAGTPDAFPLPCLEPGFRPFVLERRRFRAAVMASGRANPLKLAVTAPSGQTVSVETVVYSNPDADEAASNFRHAERLVKSLLWIGGGSRIVVAGSDAVARSLAEAYSPGGARAFDFESMTKIYGTPLDVECVPYGDAPAAFEPQNCLGRHFDGCRVGFDLGASDRKCAAMQDGRIVFSEEVVWDPSAQADPAWHRAGINDSIRRAAAHLPRVDAIGGSAAGVYIENRVRMASLFRGVPPERFEQEAAPVFELVRSDWDGVPFAVANDGEAAALAASIQLGRNSILGVSFGSSMAGGYVNAAGHITGRLNELAFVPVDDSPSAPRDEWSGDHGCGVNYFSQQGAARLATAAGLKFPADMPLPRVLLEIQALAENGSEAASDVFRSIGTAFGYTVAGFREFYPSIETAVIMGRVTSGTGGDLIVREANRILAEVFPELETVVAVPDDSMRRHGQAVAAATLPEIRT